MDQIKSEDRTKSDSQSAHRIACHQNGDRQFARWQFLVASGIRRNSESELARKLCRTDMAHSLVPPHMMTQLALSWNRQIGWHQIGDDASPDVDHNVAATPRPSELVGVDQLVRKQLGPSRPKMLDSRNVSRPWGSSHGIEHASGIDGRLTSHASVGQMAKEVSFEGQGINARARKLAYDLRCPLSAAHQTLLSIVAKVRVNNHLSLEDARLIDSIANSLAVLTGWTDDILLGDQVLHGQYHLVRRRFKAYDWWASISDLIEQSSKAYGVSLQWLGWDESLPRLYLDPNPITRSILNLIVHLLQRLQPGSLIRIRASSNHGATPTLQIALETDHCSLAPETLKLINGFGVADYYDLQSASAVTAKHFVEAQGGSIVAYNGSRGGCELCIRIPIDSADSLVRSWMLRTTQSGLLSGENIVHLFAVRGIGGDSELANVCLQQAAGPNALVIRVSQTRWLILELKAAEEPARSATIQNVCSFHALRCVPPDARREEPLNRKISGKDEVNDTKDKDKVLSGGELDRNQELPDRLQSKQTPSNELGKMEVNWLEQAVFRSQEFNPEGLLGTQENPTRISHTVAGVARQVHALLEQQSLILDGFLPNQPVSKVYSSQLLASVPATTNVLAGVLAAEELTGNDHANNKLARNNLSNNNLAKNDLVFSDFAREAASLLENDSTDHNTGSGNSRSESSLGQMRIHGVHRLDKSLAADDPGAQVVSEIIKQWKIVQAKLARLNKKLA